MGLADAIIGNKGGFFDHALFGGISELASVIESAQRFYLSPETVAACFSLSNSKPSSLLGAMPLCRPPFKRTWIEWDGDRSRIGVSGPRSDGMDHHAPSRMGAMIETIDDTFQRFGITFAWMHKREDNPDHINSKLRKGEAAVNVCPIGCVVNWHDRWPLNTRLGILNNVRRPALETRVKPDWPIARYLSDAKERAALERIDEMTVQTVTPYCGEFVKRLQKQRSFIEMERFMKSSLSDVEGELILVQTAICLINSRNCVEIERADQRRLNKRRRMTGKAPFVSYSTVRIALSRRDQRAVDIGAASTAEIRQHLVRGHFKLRRSGVYWWRPHIRGNAKFGEVRRAGYVVDGTRELAQVAA